MGLLIVFYCLFIAYSIYFLWYLTHQVRRYRTEMRSYDAKELHQSIRFVVRNLMLLSIVMIVVSTFVTYKIDIGVPSNEPWQIGLSLACATAVFYLLFLIWDIFKYRVMHFFQVKYDIELDKDCLNNGPIILIITANALLLLEVIMSVINMVQYIRS